MKQIQPFAFVMMMLEGFGLASGGPTPGIRLFGFGMVLLAIAGLWQSTSRPVFGIALVLLAMFLLILPAVLLPTSCPPVVIGLVSLAPLLALLCLPALWRSAGSPGSSARTIPSARPWRHFEDTEKSH